MNMTYDELNDMIFEYGQTVSTYSYGDVNPHSATVALAIWDEMQAQKSEINVLKARLARAQA